MKFLLITNNDTDGIGQTVINLFKNLNKEGHKAKIVTLHKLNINKNIIKIERSFFYRLFLYPLNLLKKNFSELFCFNISTIKFRDLKQQIKNSDVIIIFTFQKIISTDILNEIFLQNKLVFFRPLDMELISGGCHFNENCQKYLNNCSNCPKIYYDNIFKIASKNLLEKKKVIRKYKPKIIVQNSYVKSLVKKSSLFKYSNPKIISVGVNHDRFKYYSRSQARKKLGLPINEKIILFATYKLSSYNKGGHILIDALKIFEKKYLSKKINSKINLLTIGNSENFKISLNYIKHLNVGTTSSDKKLNLYFRAADVLVSPSIYDFGPHVVNEAISNDLPVIAFKVGTAIDVIKNGVNGFLINCFDREKLAIAIKKIILDQKKLINNNLRKKIKYERSATVEAKSFIQISKISN